MNNHELYNL